MTTSTKTALGVSFAILAAAVLGWSLHRPSKIVATTQPMLAAPSLRPPPAPAYPTAASAPTAAQVDPSPATSSPPASPTAIHDADTTIVTAQGLAVSSPAGVMVSDPAQNLIVGDLRLETEQATLDTTHAVYDTRTGTLTAESLTFTPKPQSPTPTESPQHHHAKDSPRTDQR